MQEEVILQSCRNALQPSLRRHYPVQVIRVYSQPSKQESTPRNRVYGRKGKCLFFI